VEGQGRVACLYGVDATFAVISVCYIFVYMYHSEKKKKEC